MTKSKKSDDGIKPNNAMNVDQNKDETGAQAMARTMLQPALKNALAASAFTGKMLGNKVDLPGVGDFNDHVLSMTRKAADGDLAMASKILAAQAITLDSMFAELARRTANNMGEYINAAERYGRLALKAQSNCRSTLEALAKLHQPREQTIRHVHVGQGGQAIVADQFHSHQTRGVQDAEPTRTMPCNATNEPSRNTALSGPHPLRDAMPIASGIREAQMSDARRD